MVPQHTCPSAVQVAEVSRPTLPPHDPSFMDCTWWWSWNSLDLLNCTKVRSVPSPTHPSAREDVGTIAAREQSAEDDAQSLMEVLCPFQLLYADGVE